MNLIEEQSEQLIGVLPKTYTDFSDAILFELLRIFNNSAINEVGGYKENLLKIRGKALS